MKGTQRTQSIHPSGQPRAYTNQLPNNTQGQFQRL